MKNNSGFSLVELIVVIAIMAILAGVAVPTYSKYISKANDAKVNAQLDEVKTAAFAAAAEKGTTVTAIKVTTTGDGNSAATTYDVTCADASVDLDTAIKNYIDTAVIDFKGTSYATDKTKSAGDVDWSNGTWQ